MTEFDSISKKTYKVLIELNKKLDTNDVDFLNLYLESKNQSGGGDIAVSKLNQDLQSLYVFYEDKEAHERIVNKKFLRFKSYQLRSSLSGSFDNDELSLISNEFIISNLPNHFYARIFAENLQPQNELKEIKKSNLFSNTYYASFVSELNRDQLNQRFQTRSNNNEFSIFYSYKTKAYLIVSKTNIDFIQLQFYLDQSIGISYFLKELSSTSALLQYDDYLDLNEIKSKFNFECEYLYNYKLSKLESSNNNKSKLTHHKSIQTDSSEISSCVTSIGPEPSKLESFRLNQDELVLELTQADLYADALINARQLFVNFEDILKKFDKNLIIKYISQTRTIQIVNQSREQLDQQWKEKSLNELKKYFNTRAIHKIVNIPLEIQSNSTYMQTLKKQLNKINKECPAVYLKIEENNIICYGTKNALLKKLESLPEVFKLCTLNNEIVAPNNSLMIELDQACLTYQSLLSINQIFYDFKNNLIKENLADLVREDKRLVIKSTSNQNDHSQWSARVKSFLDDYEKNRLRFKKIQIPSNLRRQKEFDDLKKHCDHFFSKEKTIKFEFRSNDCLQVFGYANQVKIFADNIQSKFSNLENNIKDRIRRKLDVKLEQNRIPLLFVLNSNNNYLKDFNNQLNKLDALAELSYLNNKLIVRIKTKMSQNKQQNEQQVELWRTKIDSFVSQYFGAFVTKRVKLPYKKQEFRYDLNKTQVILTWVDMDTVELTGLKADVERLENELFAPNLDLRQRKQSLNINNKENTNPKIMKPKANIVNSRSTSSSRSRNVSETKIVDEKSSSTKEIETFLISDLKWFQTRMLFEKKYFLFVTEMYKDLSVLVDTQLTRIYYSGTRKDIDDAKKLAFDILDQILGTEVESTPELIQKFNSNETKLLNLVKQNGLCCIIDAKSQNNKYIIYATTCEEIEKCRSLLDAVTF